MLPSSIHRVASTSDNSNHEMNFSRQSIAGWRRFLSAYYLSSALLIASYGLTRLWWLRHGDPKYARLEPHALAEKASWTVCRDLKGQVSERLGLKDAGSTSRHRRPPAGGSGAFASPTPCCRCCCCCCCLPLLPPCLQERMALSLLGVAVSLKFWRRQSLDAFLSDALTYGMVSERAAAGSS